MKKYVTIAEIWRNGLPIEVGTPIMMSDTEAKYIKHALSEVKDEPQPVELELDLKPPKATKKNSANGDVRE